MCAYQCSYVGWCILSQEMFAVRIVACRASGPWARVGLFCRGIPQGIKLLYAFIHTEVTTGVSLTISVKMEFFKCSRRLRVKRAILAFYTKFRKSGSLVDWTAVVLGTAMQGGNLHAFPRCINMGGNYAHNLFGLRKIYQISAISP